MEKILSTFKKYIVFVGVALFAVFTLPGFPSPYYIPKEIFGLSILSIALIVMMVRSIIKGELKYASGKFDIGVALFALAYLVTSIIKTPNKMEAFLYPGTTTFVVISAIFYLVINQFTKRSKNSVVLSLYISGIVLSISILFSQLGIFAKIPQLPSFMKDATFNPLGGTLQSILYLLALLPFGLVQVIKDRDIVKKTFFSVASVVMVFGITIVVLNSLPGKAQSPIMPPWQTSWEVTIETLKQSPFVGAGPANYLSAFNLYRPISYNQTSLWQTRFSSANNYYFTLITELGFVGLAALVVLFIQIYKVLRDNYKQQKWESVSILILVAGLAILPVAPSLIFLLMVLLAVFSNSEDKTFIIARDRIPTVIVSIPVFVAIVILGIFGTRAVRAEHYYQLSLEALSLNDAKNTYSYMANAETLNPYVDRYHASLAQVDMALANSLAQKTDITDTDKTTITQLVQEAIAEGKATVTLNPGRSGNWEVLGQIYRSIMSFAQGSDEFAVQTYTQAIALDPINPNLRIALGGVYYTLGDYNNALNAFQLAAVAKNNLANAYYNIAATYAVQKEYDKAITEINTVLGLVAKDSEDYKTAQTALEQLKKQKPATTNTASENLTSPQKESATNVNPPITLPSEATPPAATN